MATSNITFRIDTQQKKLFDEACAYLGRTATSIFEQSVRTTIDTYYKERARKTQLARDIADGDQYHLLLETAKREAWILQQMGIDNVFELFQNGDVMKKQMFCEFLFRKYCEDLGSDYKPMHTRYLNAQKA